MAVNITSIKTSSDGVWQGDNPQNYAFPLLIVQTALILLVSRSLAFLLKPLRQPKVTAEIVGGIVLGPSLLGRNKIYLHSIFPSWSTPILESVASIGLLFFLFLVGLELDLTAIRRSGKRAFSIAAAGVTLPFVSGIGVAFVLRKTVDGVDQVGLGKFLVFIGVALSITAFPVLARILAELKLLTTPMGETAMSAAAFNDVLAWVLLALAVALAGNGDGQHKSPLVSFFVLLSGIAFVIFMLVCIQPAMSWVARRCSQERETVDEAYICLTLAGVMVSGYITDFIGIHSIFGAFVFGLTIPKEGEFAGRLIERIEDFVSGLLLPLYFASSGLKTDVAKIQGVEAWGLLLLVIFTACVGKILGTFLMALLNKIPPREALTLGLLMNTKGLVELIVLNIGKEKHLSGCFVSSEIPFYREIYRKTYVINWKIKTYLFLEMLSWIKVLNDEIFAILVLMALITTFMTTPSVMAVYKPARASSPYVHRKLQRQSDSPFPEDNNKELRLLACVHGPSNIPSLVNFIEWTRGGTKKSPLKLYVMHLVELTERSSSIVMARHARRNGLPFINHIRKGDSLDRAVVAFQAYGQVGKVNVSPFTAISTMTTMHEDVCHMAEDKRVSMVVLPFHKREKRMEGRGSHAAVEVENMGPAWRAVNQRVLKDAPCSVAILVDRGLGGGEDQEIPGAIANVARGVCVVFFGGPDDREALELGGRMAEHPSVKVTVVRFVEKEVTESSGIVLLPTLDKSTENSYSFSTAVMDHAKEKELDEAAVGEFRKRWGGMANYMEKMENNIVEAVLTIGRSGEHELIVVGKGRFPPIMVAEIADRIAAHPELGPIGDILASPGNGVVSSVLVIQQHNIVHANELPLSKVINGNDGISEKPTATSTSSV